MNNKETILISDEKKLEFKKEIFKQSYIKHNDDDGTKDKIILVTDFDYTLFNKYNYDKGTKYSSSYGFYNQDVFGGNQKDIIEKRKIMHSTYIKYEEDLSIDIKIRAEKINEWNRKALGYMVHPNFTRDSVKKMVELKKDLGLKKKLKEFYEKLIELNIPIIIVSGGIKEIIIEFLKLINIKGLDDYINRKRIYIIANEFIFDEKTKKCIGYNDDVIHGFNKSEHVQKIINENFPNIENVFVLGDLDTDYKSIEKLNLNKDNIIGIGFIYYTPEEIKDKNFDFKNNDKINTFRKIFDINLMQSEGYDYPLDILNIFNTN